MWLNLAKSCSPHAFYNQHENKNARASFHAYTMPTASKGVLVLCDPSIKALIVQIDSQSPGIILEELDETHLLIKPEQIPYVKSELNNLLAKNIYNPFDDE